MNDCPQNRVGGIECIEDVKKREDYDSSPCPRLKLQYANTKNKPTRNGDHLKNGPQS